jgi:hypothetical protein
MYSTTPYQQPPYEAASQYRGYRLPAQSIYQTVNAQNQFWEQGAEMVRNRYQKGISLDLTTRENKEFRNQFMKNAEQEVEKMSSLDLADNSVRKKGMNLFKPLFDNKNILYDEFITKQKKSIFAAAEKAKNDPKTKGAGFNVNNLIFSLDPFEGFNENTSSKDLEALYEKSKNAAYVPYYDINKERDEILAKCGQNSVSNSAPTEGGMYTSIKNSSRSAAQVAACLKSNFTSAAKTQMYIDGYVSFKENKGQLAELSKQHFNSQNQSLLAEVKELEKSKNAAKLAGSSAEELELYDQKIINIKSEFNRNKSRLDKLNLNDFSDVENNFSDYVSEIWISKKISDMAAAYQTINYETSTKYDSDYLNFLKFQQEQANKPLEMMIDLFGKDNKNTELLDQIGKELQKRYGVNLSRGTSSDPFPGNTVTETLDIPLNKLTAEINETEKSINDMNSLISSTVNTLNKDYSLNIPTGSVTEIESFLSTYLSNPKSDKNKVSDLMRYVNGYKVSMLNLERIKSEFDNFEQSGDPQVRNVANLITKQTDDLVKKMEDNKIVVVRTDPSKKANVVLYPNDMRAVINGTHPEYSLDVEGNIVLNNNPSVSLEKLGSWNPFSSQSDAIPSGYSSADNNSVYGDFLLGDNIGLGSIGKSKRTLNNMGAQKVTTYSAISAPLNIKTHVTKTLSSIYPQLAIDNKVVVTANTVERRGNKYYATVSATNISDASNPRVLTPEETLKTLKNSSTAPATSIVRWEGNTALVDVTKQMVGQGATLGGVYSDAVKNAENSLKNKKVGDTYNINNVKFSTIGKISLNVKKISDGEYEYSYTVNPHNGGNAQTMPIPVSNVEAIENIINNLR